MKYFCNPVNMEYRYQMFQIKGQENLCDAHREAADPSIIYFKGRYYLFPSMSAGFYTSENLAGWEFHAFSGDIPIYDYAPDIRVVGDYVYCCASSHENECSFYRTKDPLTEPFEEIKGSGSRECGNPVHAVFFPPQNICQWVFCLQPHPAAPWGQDTVGKQPFLQV